MNLPTKAVWLAVHRIFSDEHVAAGCSLSLKHLMTVWPHTGMRMRDLAEGLETLASSGYMSVEMSEDGPCARLLDEQFGLTNGDAQDRHAVSTVQSLRSSRTRPTHLGTLLSRGDGRRQEDRHLHAYANAYALA